MSPWVEVSSISDPRQNFACGPPFLGFAVASASAALSLLAFALAFGGGASLDHGRQGELFIWHPTD